MRTDTSDAKVTFLSRQISNLLEQVVEILMIIDIDENLSFFNKYFMCTLKEKYS